MLIVFQQTLVVNVFTPRRD